MSVIIKGVDMPKNCGECFIGNRTLCTHGCRMQEVKTPHGKLVDLDAMIDGFWDGGYMEIHWSDLDSIPTVVEAEVDHDHKE